MTHPLYTFLWSLWRASGRTLGVIWILSVTCTAAWWYVENGTVLILEEGLYMAAMYLFWTTGMVMLLSEETTGGYQLAHPAWRFVMPLTTWKQVVVLLAYRCTMAVAHTMICIPLYEMLNFGWARLGGYTPLFAGVVLAVLGVQWAAFLSARQDLLRSITTVVLSIGALLLLAWIVTAPIESERIRKTATIAIAALPTAIICFRAAGVARAGTGAAGRALILRHRPLRPFSGQRASASSLKPASPLLAQAWLEFRSTAVWFPVAFLPICAMLLLPSLATSGIVLDAWDVGGLSSLGLGLAFATGYLWEHGNRVTSRFCLGIPMSVTTLTAARLLAALAAVLLALLGTGVLLAAGVTANILHDDSVFSFREVFAITASLATSSAPLWFIALGAGRAIALALLPSIAVLMAYVTTSDPSVQIMGVFWAVVVLAATTYALSLWAWRRCKAPTAWPLSLVLLIAANPIIAVSIINTENSFMAASRITEFAVPPLAALAILFQARRVAGFRRFTVAGLLVAFGLTFLVLRTRPPWQALNVGLVEPEAAGFAAAGLLLPLAWIPLLIRLQRSA